ncbi:MAG: choice-of-anchor Q domain-containing protein [Anaerolineales bacterium]
MHRKLTLIGALLSVLMLAFGTHDRVSAAGTIYVDVDATGGDTGASWADAYPNLQDALAAATSGDQIWVAEGVYYPDVGGGTTPDDRTATFYLVDGVEIYGGFDGTETSVAQRDWTTQITVLSGDIDQDDTTDGDGVVTDPSNIAGSNAYRVVTASVVGAATLLDGFTITAGKADGSGLDEFGAGIGTFSSAVPQLTHLTLIGNSATYGGGILNNNASPDISHVSLTNNVATSYGGGMYNSSTSGLMLTDVQFTSNDAGALGGGMYNYTSDPTLTNVHFIENTAGTGGGLYNYFSTPSIIESEFTGNSAISGGGMNNSYSDSSLYQVIFQGNEASSAGGALYNNNSNPTLESVLFSGNLGTGNAGAVFNYQAAPTFNNVTFSGNRSPVHGGGMYNNESNPSLTNVIMWDDDGSGSTDDELYNSGGSTPVISNSIIEGSGGSASWDSSFGTDGGGNLDADPLFTTPVNPANAPTTTGNLHVPVSSPAFDSGDDAACPAADLDGVSRPQGAHCDIGTYEVVGNTPGLLSLRIFRSPNLIVKGSGAAGPNQWFTRVAFTKDPGDPALPFQFVVWLHVPQDWTLPWATQYSFTGDFNTTSLAQDFSAFIWIQDPAHCSLGGPPDSGYKWRAFRGPLESLPPLVDRLNNRINLRGGLGVPGSETPGQYDNVRVVIGNYYDFDQNGTPDRYSCDQAVATNIEIQ